MRLPIIARGARRAAGVAVLLAALLVAFAPSLPAQAGAGLCRTDPVVVLTNGTVIDLGADISTGLLSLNHVTYTLHVPQGSRVLAVVHTPNLPTTTESFNIAADAAAGRYRADTVVTTAGTPAPVTVTLSVGLLRWASAQGYSGQALTVQIGR
jgi:hypothetical protein